jgi:micrococcal nuclease
MSVRLIAALAVAAALLPAGSAGADRTAAAKSATVDYVVDGDTIRVFIGGRREYVRFIGIDTPEVYGGAECGGRAASSSMKRMLEPGDRVTLVRDRSQDNRDYYDRLLRYVELGGNDLGRKQLRKGWAEVYVFDDPFARLGSYRRAEDKARDGDRGVWGRCGGFESRIGLR